MPPWLEIDRFVGEFEFGNWALLERYRHQHPWFPWPRVVSALPAAGPNQKLPWATRFQQVGPNVIDSEGTSKQPGGSPTTEAEKQWRLNTLTVAPAWFLYKRARDGRGAPLILGDTQIRFNLYLMAKHAPISTPGGHAGQNKYLKAFKDLAGVQSPDPGFGSILSDQGWTPIMNDALILGGCHATRHFVVHKDEQPQGAAAAPKNTKALVSQFEMFQGAGLTGPAAAWALYFKKNRKLLWDGFARVLSREILGLRHCGYTPEFADSTLTFKPGPGTGRPHRDFKSYLDALSKVGAMRGDERAIVGTIADYLFKSPTALS